MIYVLAFQFHAYLQCSGAQLTKCLNTVLKVKALVGALNQEKALVGAFSVIVKSSRTFVWSSTWQPRMETESGMRMQERRKSTTLWWKSSAWDHLASVSVSRACFEWELKGGVCCIQYNCCNLRNAEARHCHNIALPACQFASLPLQLRPLCHCSHSSKIAQLWCWAASYGMGVILTFLWVVFSFFFCCCLYHVPCTCWTCPASRSATSAADLPRSRAPPGSPGSSPLTRGRPCKNICKHVKIFIKI